MHTVIETMGIGQLGGYSAMHTASKRKNGFHELELHIDSKILTTYSCRTKNYLAFCPPWVQNPGFLRGALMGHFFETFEAQQRHTTA